MEDICNLLIASSKPVKILSNPFLLNAKEDKDLFLKTLISLNKESYNPLQFVLILWLETEEILEQYSTINFKENPEFSAGIRTKGYAKFYAHVDKVLKSGKAILALYILNNEGGYSDQSDITLWIDSYINILASLDRFDILAHYYDEFNQSIQNIQLLKSITEYYIKEQNLEKAKETLNDISKIEPKYPFITEAQSEIERLSMIQKLTDEGTDIDSINQLTGIEFEELLIAKFRSMDFTVINTPKSGDFGADIILDTKDGTRFVIQCKRFKSKVNLKAVQEVVGALPHYSGDIGIVITNSGFLSSAIKLAQSNDIELWDNIRLMKFLSGDITFSQLG